jgi:hypothetical protein
VEPFVTTLVQIATRVGEDVSRRNSDVCDPTRHQLRLDLLDRREWFGVSHCLSAYGYSSALSGRRKRLENIKGNELDRIIEKASLLEQENRLLLWGEWEVNTNRRQIDWTVVIGEKMRHNAVATRGCSAGQTCTALNGEVIRFEHVSHRRPRV